MTDYISKKLVFKIYQLEDDSGYHSPALEDIESHETTPTWVAGLMYVVLDRYLTCIPDANQKKFKESTIKWLAEMIKDDAGADYVDKIDPKDLD